MNSTTLYIHAVPTGASCAPENGGEVTIDFEGWGYLAIFTGSAQLSEELSEAIAAVLTKHKHREDAVQAYASDAA